MPSKFKHQVLFLTLILITGFVFSLLIGPANSSFWPPSTEWDIVRDLRLPRALTAALAGACVSFAGALSQNLFRNILATPSIVGTEAGSAFFVALAITFFGTSIDPLFIVFFAILGGFFATLFTARFGSSENQIVKLLLGGFALNALLASFTSLLVSFQLESGQGQLLYNWLMGSFSSRTWEHAAVVLMALVSCAFFSLRNHTFLDALALGDDLAQTHGIPVRRLRLFSLLIIATLVGVSISVGGVLPFIGLIVPHFIRMKTSSKFGNVLVLSGLAGAALTTLADLACRTVLPPVELNIGIISTIIGAPYFIWLINKETRL